MMKRMHTKGEATHDLMLVIALVLGLGIAWVATGGPGRSELTDESPLGIQRFTSRDVIPGFQSFFIPITRDLTLPGGVPESARSEFERIQAEMGSTQNIGDVSPYFGHVTIVQTTSGVRETSPDREYVVLEVSQTAPAPVALTGWKLQSMVSNQTVEIGKATRVSTSGNVNVEEEIVASSRDRLYILTGHSPIGTSFQLNICSGYFEQFQNFTPQIPERCPLPKEELTFAGSDAIRFGSECLEYIERLPQCDMPLAALPLGFSDSCAAFITEKINYTSCVKNHRAESGFRLPEWRVYLRHNEELWQKSHETIRLLDASGKTVDVYSY